MDPELSPDELLEEEEQQPASSASAPGEAPEVSPFDRSRNKGDKKGGGKGKQGILSSKDGKKGGGNGKGAQAGKKAGAKSKSSSLKNPKNLLKGGKTAGNSKTERAINQAAAQAAKLIPYVGKIASLVIKKLGIKRIAYILIGILMAPAVITVLLIFSIVMIIHEAPKAVLSYAWSNAKHALGFSMQSTIDSGGAGKFAYEYEVKDGTSAALAAPDGEKPKEGTLAYKYSLIDWEKAKYKVVQVNANCDIQTKKVESVIDGAERSVVDKVVFKDTGKEALSPAIANNCIEQNYPIFNTIMRSQFLRQGINKEIGVRFAYAEPKDSKAFDGKKQDEIDKILREKTLKRVWNAGLKTTVSADTANQAAQTQQNQNEGDSQLGKIDELIKQRDGLKNPCEGRSINACENSADADQAKLLEANTKIIDALHPKYKDKISPNDTTGGNYFALKSEVDKQCTNAFHIPQPCPQKTQLQNAANKYADQLIALYKQDGSKSNSQPSSTPSAAAAPAAPPNPTNGWPTSCQENFQPTQGDDVDKAIANAVNDLLCGLEPKDIVLKGIELPQEVRGADPNIASDQLTTASIKTLCQFTTRLLTNDSYKQVLRYRIASAANAAWETVTYADTTRKRFIKLSEASGDFYKVSNFQKGQEYNVPVNNSTAGDPLEQIAIGDAIGTQRTFLVNGTGDDGGVGDKLYKQFVASNQGGVCQLINQSGGKIYDRGSIQAILSKFHLIPGFNNIVDASIPNFVYKTDYQDLKKAIAALPYYTQKEPDVEKSARNMTLGDVIIYLVKARSNVSDTGTEEGPQNFNRTSLGMKAYMNAYALATGGQFLRSEQSIALETQNEAFRRFEEKRRGIAYRLFDSSNPRSLASRLTAAAVAKPTDAAKNIASNLVNIFNPIDSIVSGRKSLVYYLTGDNNTALAASDYDRLNLRLDPAGMPNEMFAMDPLKNAAEIEKIKEGGGYQTQFFSAWDGCFQKFIPTEELHLQEDNPECIILATSNKDLQRDYSFGDLINKAKDSKFAFLKPVTDKLEEAAKSDSKIKNQVVWPYSLATKYRLYHYNNLQADAMIYLSDPNKTDESLNASSSSTQGGSANCAGAQGNEKILCEALKYDPLGYQQLPYGHVPPPQWHQNCPTIDPNNEKCKLDCSGLVSLAVFDAFGVNELLTSNGFQSSPNWKRIDWSQLKPGDIVSTSGQGHVAIIESHQAGSNQAKIFQASTSSGPLEDQINHRDLSLPNGRLSVPLRYVGPGSTP